MTRYEIKTFSGDLHTVSADRFIYDNNRTVAFLADRDIPAVSGRNAVTACDTVAVYHGVQHVREVPGDRVKLSPQDWTAASVAAYLAYRTLVPGGTSTWEGLSMDRQEAWKHVAAAVAELLGLGLEREGAAGEPQEGA